VPTTIKLTRAGFGIELRRGEFEVSLDGQTVGSVEPHGSFETAVDPGHHTLRVQRGRYVSPVRDFDAADGETVFFRCHGVNLWFLWVASLAVPSLGISLRRE
jgi:hypothetical protein